jgi:hypothetical protein
MPQITLRLTLDEQSRLTKMSQSDVTGAESESDLLRLLLHREWNRRHGLPKPKPSDYQGVYRVGGRPKQKFNCKVASPEMAATSDASGVGSPSQFPASAPRNALAA